MITLPDNKQEIMNIRSKATGERLSDAEILSMLNKMNKDLKIFGKKDGISNTEYVKLRAILTSPLAQTTPADIPAKALGTNRVKQAGLIYVDEGEAIVPPSKMNYKDTGSFKMPNVPEITTAVQHLANSLMGLTAEAKKDGRAEINPVPPGVKRDVEDEIKKRDAEDKPREIVSPELASIQKTNGQQVQGLVAIAKILADMRSMMASRGGRRKGAGEGVPEEDTEPFWEPILPTEWFTGRFIESLIGLNFSFTDKA